MELASKDFRLSGAIYKVTPTADGGREVQGYATVEVPDIVGEIIDFDPTFKALQDWSSDQLKASGGKSYGNVRKMHQLEAVGKLTAAPLSVTTTDKDGNEVKAVWVTTYTPPSHPDVIKDLDEGILTGFSVGGKYATAPIYDAEKKARKYTPAPVELSYVDKPCVPGSDFTAVIAKAAGMPQKGETMAKLLNREDLAKASEAIAASSSINNDFDGSFDAIERAVRMACSERYKGPDSYWHGYLCRTYADKAIICIYSNSDDKSKYYVVPYTIDEKGIVTLSEATEVQQVTAYLPVEMQKAVEDELRKAALGRAGSATQPGDDSSITMEVQETMNPDEIRKAAEAAGLKGDELETFVQKMTKAADPPDTSDEETPDEDDVVVAESAKAAGILPDALKTFTDELAKAGRSISATNAKHLEAMHKTALAAAEKCVKAAEFIGQVKDSLLTGKAMDDKALEIGEPTIPPSTNPDNPLLAPEVVSKAVGEELNKAGMSDLKEQAASFLPEVQKAFGAMSDTLKPLLGMADQLADLKKTVQEIANQPIGAGPIFNAQRVQAAGTVGERTDIVRDFVKSIQDPGLRDRVGQELALQMAKGQK